MSVRSMLVIIGANCPRKTLEGLIDYAHSEQRHLSISVLETVPPVQAYSYSAIYGGISYVEEWNDEIKDQTRSLNAKSDEIEKMVQDAELSADVLIDLCDLSLVEDMITRRSAVTDLIVFPID